MTKKQPAKHKRVSEIQERAEKIYARFKRNPRRPIVIEFSGSPKAGKTTVIAQVQAFLKRVGFKTEVVVERASICPIRDKQHSNFNVWTATTTLAQILEKTQTPHKNDDPEILILDRGIFDSLVWLRVMESLAKLRKRERETIEKFLLLGDWRERITGVVLMRASPEDSLERERGHLPVFNPDGSTKGGSVMNTDVLQRFSSTLESVAADHSEEFRIAQFNTSDRKVLRGVPETCAAVANQVLDWIDAELRERVLAYPKARIAAAFEARKWLTHISVQNLIKSLEPHSIFAERSLLESNDDYVQPIPVVIVRNKNGEILVLRRKERDQTAALHEKVVIWAGGHVREDDKFAGEALRECAVRELQEELRLRVEASSLFLRGAVYIQNSGPKTARHIAIVYEWQAKTQDVEVVLSTAEFVERSGNSQSGTFMSVLDVEQLSSPSETEPWSWEILKGYLAGTTRTKKDLFD